MGIGRHPDESPAYAKLRDELREAEIGLRDQREAVAALRRRLPQDGLISNFDFRELRGGSAVSVRLSELFEDPGKPLVLMHFMFGKRQENPCPMCTLWADGYNGIVAHLRQRANFAVLVAGDVERFSEYARGRGWTQLRLVSAADSTLKRELGFETEDGAQNPGVSVFLRRPDGSLIHLYSQGAGMDPDEVRGMDLLSPFWHFLDLTPEGRGDFFPSLEYHS